MTFNIQFRNTSGELKFADVNSHTVRTAVLDGLLDRTVWKVSYESPTRKYDSIRWVDVSPTASSPRQWERTVWGVPTGGVFDEARSPPVDTATMLDAIEGDMIYSETVGEPIDAGMAALTAALQNVGIEKRD